MMTVNGLLIADEVAFLDFKSVLLAMQQQRHAHTLPGLSVKSHRRELTYSVVGHKDLQALICN